ncbi:MAG: hypothetical protein ACRDOX_06975 [Nocardioides sp.]
MNALLLAADLWANPLAPPAEVSGTSDPQSPYRSGRWWGAVRAGRRPVVGPPPAQAHPRHLIVQY